MVWKKKQHSTCAIIQELIVKGICLLLKLRWETQGKKEGCKTVKGSRRKSAEITLFFLYGFLDAQKHGSEPLVQPWNGVILFHLPFKKEILPKITLCTHFFCYNFVSSGKLLCSSKLVHWNGRSCRKNEVQQHISFEDHVLTESV